MSLADNCNTFITNGFHLEDLAPLRGRVRESVRLHAQDNSFKDFPSDFHCSHCNNSHPISPEGIKKALFEGPGQVDFMASNNEYLAMIEQVPVASLGDDYGNGTSRDTKFVVSELIEESAEEVEPTKEKEVQPQAKEETKTTKAKAS